MHEQDTHDQQPDHPGNDPAPSPAEHGDAPAPEAPEAPEAHATSHENGGGPH